MRNLPVNGQPYSREFVALGNYRLISNPGRDGDVHITGLPLHNVESTVQQLEIIEIIVFGGALLVIGVAGTGWVRLSLRPLRKVTATAAEVTRMSLSSGEVTLPNRVPDADPRTEVGQLGEAFNRMLGHVGEALGTRHASEARLRQFIADASHELRTPLAGIRGYTELALRGDGPLDPKLRHALSRVDAESGRMSRLVDDLLLLARLDAGRPLAHEPVDLTRLAIDVTNDARVAGPGQHWVLDLPGEPVSVTGDEHRLHQVLANLLTNARAHTPPGTTVTVRLIPASADDGTGGAELTVSDDGPGIPAQLQAGVWERFARGDSARSRKAGSTGLGLAIVAAVVTAHHGQVSLASRPGKTTFRIWLPADQGRGQAPA
jgi:two-component system OmpR family sensor kinase